MGMMRADAIPDDGPSMREDASSPISKVSIPEHVVYRALPSETVVFNLRTGKYHGLNATAGSMLEALQQTSRIRDAAATVAEQFTQPQALVERDMCQLCDGLLERGLIERDGDSEH
jgi:Coenzyme PQQ synthesis protein D (PqqD)